MSISQLLNSVREAADLSEPGALRGLWKSVTKLDRGKMNHPWIALRNALGVAIPLSIGIAIGNPLGAVAVSTGALNVCYSDGVDPYPQRARRMLLWSVLGAIAVFVGSVTGPWHGAAIVVAAAWAFVGGLFVSVSQKAGDLGLNTLVTVIVFAARGALSPEGALIAALLVLCGGLLQMLFALLFWAIRRYEPERRAVGKVYLDLAQDLDPTTEITVSSPLNTPPAQVQETLSALGRDHSLEGERFRLLFDQADRLRMSTFSLVRLRTDLTDRGHNESGTYIEEALALSSKLLAMVGHCLTTGECMKQQRELMLRLQEMLDLAHASESLVADNKPPELGPAMDVLAGQLRLVVQLANNSTPSGLDAFAKRQLAQPWRLQIAGRLNTLRANLHWRSAACRHAIRLAACVAIADAIGRSISWERSYWLPMTVAVILRPDFTSTISRGVLRLAGTFAGLVLATILYHVFPQSAISELLLVGVFTFLLRYVGPANYGVFSVAISGLIVFLIAETGIAPGDVVLQRALNTAAGGVFALIAYLLWPTWEKKSINESLAQMLDSCRHYFHSVVLRFESDEESVELDLDHERDEWRRTRSNAEASVDRFTSEPGVAIARLELLTSMLASSHAFAEATMELEAEIIETAAHRSPAAFRNFANDVEFTLYFLAAALRGSTISASTLPPLREDHTRLVASRSEFAPEEEFVLLQADRLTVSLNTLREQVLRYVGQQQLS